MDRISTIFGFNIIGYASANTGLGTTTREFVQALLARGENVRIFDLDPGAGRGKFDNRFAHLTVEDAKELPYEVNLFIISALSLPDFALVDPKNLQREGRLNVAFAWWELSDIPKHWSDAAQLFDVLIAGSDFVRNAFATHIPRVPVLLASHPIQMPEQVFPNRCRFGLPEEGFLVYMGFEPASDSARKNPFGAVEAFNQAFPNDPNCHLVIKVNNPHVNGKPLDLLEQMYAITQSNQRIHLIHESLPYDELLSLYASCDAFISLHRSEGLGLIPLEAMRLGKPIVATGWSGNMSYMNYRNACLVDYEFVGTGDSHFYGSITLGIDGFWAEPDVAQGAAWLRKLASDQDFRANVGDKAASDASRYQEQAMKMLFVDELKCVWENRDLKSPRDRRLLCQSALASLRSYEQRHTKPLAQAMKQAQETIKRELNRHMLWRFK